MGNGRGTESRAGIGLGGTEKRLKNARFAQMRSYREAAISEREGSARNGGAPSGDKQCAEEYESVSLPVVRFVAFDEKRGEE